MDEAALAARVVLLPHLGSATTSTRLDMARIAVGSVLDALAGKRPRTLVNNAVWKQRPRLRGAVGQAAR